VTTSNRYVSPRALTLAASIAWQHVSADPVRALLLAWRVLPGSARGWLRLAGPYGRATVLWGAGGRQAALAALDASPRRLATFALAADQPAAAAQALARLDPAPPVLTARLAWREGRLTDALRALDGARGIRARRLRATLAAEQSQGQSMIVASSAQIAPKTGHDHESGGWAWGERGAGAWGAGGVG